MARWLFPVPGGPRKWIDLIAADELELRESQNPVPVEGGLEREVESGERLDGRELGHPERHLHPPVLAQSQFLGEQGIDHLQGAGLAALELTHGLVKDLQCSRHLQANQGSANAVENRGDDLQCRGHGCSPWHARRRPTA